MVYKQPQGKIDSCLIKNSFSGSIAVTLAVRIASPSYFSSASHEQRPLVLFIVVVPYFVCFVLSFLCALYVVKALLHQIRRDKKVM